MPYHTDNKMPKMSKDSKPSKMKRDLTEKEKKLLKEHYKQHDHTPTEKSKMTKEIKNGKEIKSMAGLMKVHKKLFGN